MNWTRRFALSAGLSLLFFLVLANWLGTLPNTGTNILVCAALLALVGLYAVRVSPVGIGLGLFLALFALNADQATLALGLPQLPAGIQNDYWFTNILPAAAVWSAFPMLARVIAGRLPRPLGGVAVGLALLPLPALRYFLRPDVLGDIYLRPRPGNFAILPVPWLAAVGLTTVLATLALLFIQRPALGPMRRFVIPALVAITLIVPVIDTVNTEAYLRAGLDVQPSRGGPLTQVTVRARLGTDAAAQVTWDDGLVTTGAFLQPLRPFAYGGITRADVLPALSDHRPGTHQLGLRAGDDARRAVFEIVAPSGLQITLVESHVLVSGGAPNAELDILTVGPSGPELLHRRFDASGSWRSPLALADASSVTVVAQSGDTWASLNAQAYSPEALPAARRGPDGWLRLAVRFAIVSGPGQDLHLRNELGGRGFGEGG